MIFLSRRPRSLFFLALLAAPAAAQVDYTLAFEPGGKSWKVEAHFPGRGEEELDFWMPLWTPGAYHVAEYGRFVDQLEASDGNGAALAVERAEKERSHYVVRGTARAKEVVVRYQARSLSSGLFTNGVIDVEANRIAQDYAFVNPVSLFGFVPARASEPVRLRVKLPAGWKAASVLEQDAGGRFLAPTYFRFEDSPLFFSPTLETATFEVDGKPHAVTVQGRSAADARTIAAGCKRIVTAASALMQGLPYDRYRFLIGFVEPGGGSGLEHSFSTLILVDPKMSIAEDSQSFWGIVAHEYFHLWCAERIHVEGIQHPDYTKPFETGTIWVNEGITEYFSRHILFHAGFLDEASFLGSYFEGGAPESMAPRQSWTDVSRATVDWHGTAGVGTFVLRMYAVGPRTILALDLDMRRATDGERGVLDLLRYLMKEYVQKDRGFGEDELPEILAHVAGTASDDFYARFIDGEELPDPAAYLDVIGYRADESGVRALGDASAAQLRARKDFLSASGEP